MELIDEQAIQEFTIESLEHIENIEPDLLELEEKEGTASSEIVHRIFRAIHSIKGGAGFLPFEALKKLTHTMESVLVRIRDGEISITSPCVDALLNSIDRLRYMLTHISTCETVPIDQDLKVLETYLIQELNSNNSDSSDLLLEEISHDFHSIVATSVLKATQEQGNFLYYIRLNVGEIPENWESVIDEMKTVGKFIASSIDPLPGLDSLQNHDIFEFVFASVLEPDLLETMLPFPKRCYCKFNLKSWPENDSKTKNIPVKTESIPAKTESENISDQSHAQPQTVRLRLDTLDHLMNIVSELVIVRNQINQTLKGYEKTIPNLRPILQSYQFVMRSLQETAMQTRMQPLGALFNRNQRLVRDLAKKSGKKVELKIEGSEVEVDRNVLELLNDPLTHMLRNCVDHGIEVPEERRRQGKSEYGRILLSAKQLGGQISIVSRDDGCGIDLDLVKQKAIKNNIINAQSANSLSENEVIDLIFTPGFSTAETVSDVSGRGVGLDVVRCNIEKLGGTIEVESHIGEGSQFTLRLPLSLAIMQAMVISSGQQRYAIPQLNIDELLVIEEHQINDYIEMIHQDPVLRLRNRLLPLVRLSEALNLENYYWDELHKKLLPDNRKILTDRRSPVKKNHTQKKLDEQRKSSRRIRSENNTKRIVVVRDGVNLFALFVDYWFDTEDIVVKTLSQNAASPLFNGATILGDGQVILILDASGLASQLRLNFDTLHVIESERRLQAEQKKKQSINKEPFIIFSINPNERFGLAQKCVFRLETVNKGDLQQIGEWWFMHYNGGGLPIFELNRVVPVRSLPEEQNELFVIVLKQDGCSQNEQRPYAGLLVSSILNVKDLHPDWEKACTPAPGVLGSISIDGLITQIIDPYIVIEKIGGIPS